MEVNVLGRTIRVRFVTEKELRVLGEFDPSEDAWGSYQAGVIYINSEATPEQNRRCLIHELSHAIFEITGLTNLLPENQEEAICDSLESLVSVFNSPEALNFLKDQETK